MPDAEQTPFDPFVVDDAPSGSFEEPQPLKRVEPAPPRRFAWLPAIGLVVGIALIAFLPRFMHRPGATPAPSDDPAAAAPATTPARTDNAPSVGLRVLVGHFDGDAWKIERNDVGDEPVPGDATLRFELETSRIAVRYIFAIDAEGNAIPVYPPAARKGGLEKGGNRPVAWRTEPVNFEVSEVPGPYTFVAAASPVPFDTLDAVVEVWRTTSGGGDAGDPARDIVFSSVKVAVN